MADPFLTDDKSNTLFSERFGEHYHSTFGAITESNHIFIDAGLKFKAAIISKINILEMGFGTGLNALLSYKFALANKIKINYFGIEAFPITEQDAEQLNYTNLLETDKDVFLKMHNPNSQTFTKGEYFSFEKYIGKFEDSGLPGNHFDLVYFDAFSPDSQPELWTKDIFEKVNKSLKSGGILTTYSCKGLVKRNLKSSGFNITKLPGPPGKREFLRAEKVLAID